LRGSNLEAELATPDNPDNPDLAGWNCADTCNDATDVIITTKVKITLIEFRDILFDDKFVFFEDIVFGNVLLLCS
jgi:hypothetical protein